MHPVASGGLGLRNKQKSQMFYKYSVLNNGSGAFRNARLQKMGSGDSQYDLRKALKSWNIKKQ